MSTPSTLLDIAQQFASGKLSHHDAPLFEGAYRAFQQASPPELKTKISELRTLHGKKLAIETSLYELTQYLDEDVVPESYRVDVEPRPCGAVDDNFFGNWETAVHDISTSAMKLIASKHEEDALDYSKKIEDAAKALTVPEPDPASGTPGGCMSAEDVGDLVTALRTVGEVLSAGLRAGVDANLRRDKAAYGTAAGRAEAAAGRAAAGAGRARPRAKGARAAGGRRPPDGAPTQRGEGRGRASEKDRLEVLRRLDET